MIRGEKFLGFAMGRQSSRRRLVLLYSTMLITLGVLTILWPKTLLPAMVCQCLTLGGLLGGIRGYGPVKKYEGGEYAKDDFTRTTASFPVQTLNLDGHLDSESRGLDEREHAERDRAHYMAYRALRYIVPTFSLGLAFGIDQYPVSFRHAAPGLLWLMVLLTLSLPQSIILWTEPENAMDTPFILRREA